MILQLSLFLYVVGSVLAFEGFGGGSSGGDGFGGGSPGGDGFGGGSSLPPIESCCCNGNSNSIAWNGNLYKFLDCVFPWDEAQKICEDWGGYLVNIGDVREAKWIKQQLDWRYGDAYGVWIGLSRPNCHSNTDWNWAGGNGQLNRYSGYSNWLKSDPVQPNCNYKPNELVVHLTENQYWVDTERTIPMKAICEQSDSTVYAFDTGRK